MSRGRSVLPKGLPLALEEFLQFAQREAACRRQVERLRHVLPLHFDVGDRVGDFICHRHWVHVHSTPGIRLFIFLVHAEASTATLNALNRHEAHTLAGMIEFDPAGCRRTRSGRQCQPRRSNIGASVCTLAYRSALYNVDNHGDADSQRLHHVSQCRSRSSRRQVGLAAVCASRQTPIHPRGYIYVETTSTA